jgi:hypothetical protein
MNRDEIREAISGFLALLDGVEDDAEAREAALALALDRLALGYHYSECEFDETDHPDAPRKDYQECGKQFQRSFPNMAITMLPQESALKLARAGYTLVMP